MKKIIVLLCLGLFLGGCASIAEHRAAERAAARLAWETKLQAWIGLPFEDIMRVAGYPQSEVALPNGNKAYRYSYEETQVYSVPNRVYKRTEGYKNIYEWEQSARSIRYWCNTDFEVNGEGVIVAFRTEGNVYRLK